MIWAVRQLLVPCNYLRIRQGSGLLTSKRVYDYVLPAVLTASTVGICVVISAPLALGRHGILMKSLADLLALLIAFYMAALAAVSTFERKGIDEKLKGSDALLNVLNHDTGKRGDKKLSYRQFISYLFGYLAFLSLVLFMAMLFFKGAWPKIVKISDAFKFWDVAVKYWLDPIFFTAFFFGIWQLFITSLLGIYFLADRMQSITDPHN